MYRAVIIYCLIAVGYAGTVSPVYYENRETRQVSTASPAPAAPPPASTKSNNNTQFLYPYPAYPEYVQNKESPVAETTPQENSELTVVEEKPEPPSYLSSLKPYVQSLVLYGIRTGNYLLQILGVVLLGTSVISVICSYTSICNLLEINQASQNMFIDLFFFFSSEKRSERFQNLHSSF